MKLSETKLRVGRVMAKFVACSAESQAHIRSDIQRLANLVHEYRWIIDVYVSDFYTHKHWDQLPKSLQEYFDHVEPPDLSWMLGVHKDNKHPPITSIIPLSLLALQCCIQNLALQRLAVDVDSSDTKSTISSYLLKRCTEECETLVAEKNSPASSSSVKGNCTAVETDAIHLPNYKNGQCMDMQHIFRKHVKPKKQHEIDKLGQVVSLLSHLIQCGNVVDVGAGLGHLSRLLTFQHGLRVTTVEAADGHAPKAAALDRELKKDVHKALKKRKMAAFGATASAEDKISTTSELVQGDCTMTNSQMSQTDSVMLPQDSSCKSNGMTQTNSTFHEIQMSHSNQNFSAEQLRFDVERLDHTVSSNTVKLKSHANPTKAVSELQHGKVESEEDLPNHVICMVQPDIAACQFLDIIKQRTQSENEENTSNSFVLVGLHACGDLTPTLLRVFVNSPSAIGLASVACCYMKISSSSAPDSSSELDLDNYPMSKYLKCLPHHHLSYEAREMACHFADAYHQRLKDNPPHLKIHSYRAALQYLVTTVSSEFKSGQVRLTCKKGADGSFRQYAKENLKKVNIPFDDVPETLKDYCEQLTVQWKRVVAFYTLRLSLAPAVETLLLLDRALFLLENGISSVLVPIFDSSISPRNFALLAIKGQ